MDRDVVKGLVATVGYVGTHHIRQVVGIDANSGYVSSLGSSTRPVFANANAAGGVRRNVNQLLLVEPYGTVSYSGLQAQLTERQLKSFQFGYAFTWSHTLNNYDTNSTLGAMTFNSANYIGRNYANSGFDRTFIHALWTVWQTPVGPGRQFLNSGIVGRIVGGWDLNTVTIYDSGSPFQITGQLTVRQRGHGGSIPAEQADAARGEVHGGQLGVSVLLHQQRQHPDDWYPLHGAASDRDHERKYRAKFDPWAGAL